MQENLIELNQINKHFKAGNNNIPILKNISMEIKKGAFFMIMGPSGSGKSTLINILGFLDTEFSGSYEFEKISYTGVSDKELAKVRRDNIGFVFQNFKLIKSLNVRDNISIPLIYSGVSRRKKKVEDVLKLVGLVNKAEAFPNELSGGQQQRVAIARAIINQPQVIIADEPTGALDSKNSVAIMDIFKMLNNQGTTIIMVTHDDTLKKYSNQLVGIVDGKLVDYRTLS